MYETILEIGYTVIRNGLTWTSALAVLFILLKQRNMKKRLKKVIPWLFQGDNEVKDYVKNQQRIESKIDLLLEERGLSWAANSSEATTTYSAEKNKTPYISRSVGFITAGSVRRFTNWIIRRMKAMQKFKSRKFWMAVVTAILVVLNDGLDLGIDSETVLAFAGLVATWIIGESAIDAKRAGKESVTHEPTQHPIDTDSRV